MSTPAVAYRRVSTQMQTRDGHSLDQDQPWLIERLARSHDLEVVAEFTDVGSAGTHARRGLLDLLDYVVENRITAIVVAAADRITRSQSAQERGALQDVLTRQKVTIVAGDGTFDLSQASNILTWDVTTAVSAHRLREISSSLRASHRRSAEAGIFRASWTPIGYRRVYRTREERERTHISADLVPDEHMGPVVQDIFEQYVGGAAMQEICNAFNEAGHRTNRGKPLLHPGLKVMLTNGIYAGVLVRDADDERIVREAVNVEPLITVDVWRAACDRLAIECVFHPRTRQSRAIFAGLLRCDACGARVWRLSGKKGDTTSPIYYRCRHAIYHAGCSQPAVREAVILEAVIPYLVEWFRPEALAVREAEREERREQLDRRREVVRQQLDMLTTLHLRSAEDPAAGIGLAEYDQRAIPLREELAKLEQQAAEQATPLAPKLDPSERETLLRTLDRAALQRLLKSAIKSIRVRDRAPVMPPEMRR